jgi:hypothetical protein
MNRKKANIMLIRLAALSGIIVISLSIIASNGSENLIQKDNAPEEDCKATILAIYNKYKDNEIEKGKAFYMKYKLVSKNCSPDFPLLQSQKIEVITATNQSRFITEKVCIYQDNTHKVSVLSDQKTIYISDSEIKHKPHNQNQQLEFFQNDMLSNAKVDQCYKDNEVSSGNIYCSKLYLDSVRIKRYSVKSLEYKYDRAKKEILQLTINYIKGKKLKYKKYEFIDLKFDYSDEKLSSTAKSFIINSNGQIRKEYKDYKVIDLTH